MHISDLISPSRVVGGVKATSKKRALEAVSALLAKSDPNLTDAEVFDCLLAREKLGSTGMGHGVAIPHGRSKKGTRAVGAFIQLEKGVDYDAVDSQSVQLLFALIVPLKSTEEHLQILATLAEMFSDTGFREQLAKAPSSQALYDLLVSWESSPPQRSVVPGG